MSIQIIGAGFPRTGTTTLKSALQTLGFNDTYHFKDLIANSDKLKYWQELENKGTTDFNALFEGYKATVDFPGYPYYKILMKQYPDAKVILSKRDFEQWYESVNKTIWKAGPQTLIAKMAMLSKMIFNKNLRNTFKCIKFMRKTFLVKQFDGKFDHKEKAKEVFHQHINEVIAHVPKDKLLVFDPSQGWKPLCDFLNLSIPEVEFPHLNKKEHFHEMVKGMIKEASKG